MRVLLFAHLCRLLPDAAEVSASVVAAAHGLDSVVIFLLLVLSVIYWIGLVVWRIYLFALVLRLGAYIPGFSIYMG